jgi:hypothetical protein
MKRRRKLTKSEQVVLKVAADCRRVKRDFMKAAIDYNEARKRLKEIEKKAFEEDPNAEPDGDITYYAASTLSDLDACW